MFIAPHQALAHDLSVLRREGRTGDLQIGPSSLMEAEALQALALSDYCTDCVGYALAGTNEICRRALGLSRPIFSPLPATDRRENGATIRVPDGVIGAQFELAFVLAEELPENLDERDIEAVARCVLAVAPAISLVGRRTRAAKSEAAAVADFALHVATVRGGWITDAAKSDLDKERLTLLVNGAETIAGLGDVVLGHPLNVLPWLQSELAKRGTQLEPGELVTTGSFGPIVQIVPGQNIVVTSGGLGSVECRLA